MERVHKVAEAVLYEGYLLYPYTRTAMKNQQRWTFGGVYPREYSEAEGGNDPWIMQTECLVLGDADTSIDIIVRFLQVVQRRVMARGAGGRTEPVDELRVGNEVYRPWEEAIEREVTIDSLPVRDLLRNPVHGPISIVADRAVENLTDDGGPILGDLIREWDAIEGDVEVSIEPVAPPIWQEPRALYRLTVKISNATPWSIDTTPQRSGVVRQSMISTHTILHVEGGDFISLLEPSDEYRAAAEACSNVKTWPVLVGDAGEHHTILSSPIILYDYPEISSQSKGNYFDATEIDELLALSVMTLTDDEKQELRESDPRGREILERTESLSEEELMNLHGIVRGLQESRRPF